jgi:hypothetical protein
MDRIGLVLTSHTGNAGLDEPDEDLKHTVFPESPCFPFKSLCGDYPTASGFALWLATCLVSTQKQPSWMTGFHFPLSNILIHHRSGNTHHSFFLISAC